MLPFKKVAGRGVEVRGTGNAGNQGAGSRAGNLPKIHGFPAPRPRPAERGINPSQNLKIK
jgi:hypothetical protein